MILLVVLKKKLMNQDKLYLVSSSKPLEFNIAKDAIKSSLGFQLTRINGTNVSLTDKKVHNFFIKNW